MRPNFAVWIPAFTALVLAIAVIGVAGLAVNDIRRQNEAVKDRNEAVAEAERALWAVRRIQKFAQNWVPSADPQSSDQDFDYLDTYRTLEDLLRPQGFLALAPEEHAAKAHALLNDLAYSEHLDTAIVARAAQSMEVLVDDIRRGQWARKRDSYVTYYQTVQATSRQLETMFLLTGALALLIALPFAWWSGMRLQRRTENAALSARALAGLDRQHDDPLTDLEGAMTVIANRFQQEGAGSRLVDALDEERRRIALDMHDEVLTELTALSRVAEKMESDAANPSGPRNIKEGLRDIATDIRNIIDDLYPPVIETLGLEAALEGCTDRLAGRFPEMRFAASVEEDAAKGLAREKALAIYRIVRESLANAIRHAGADRIDVDLHRNGNTLSLSIEDNGDKVAGDTPPIFSEGRGTAGMRHRAARLGGTVRWERSRFSSGTKVVLEVPIP